MRHPGPFRFKQFSVEHSASSMRVGVDGVLVGAWAGFGNAEAEAGHALDAGCGCGVIALMLAQRFPEMRVDAVDIDSPSVKESAGNIAASPWSRRVAVAMADITVWADSHEAYYDLIVSNPPYFNDGIDNPSTPRELARHQSEFSPAALLRLAGRMLRPGGRVALVLPASMAEDLIPEGERFGLAIERITLVRGNPAVEPKRALMQFYLPSATDSEQEGVARRRCCRRDMITIETAPGDYAEDYKALTKEFYLKF